VNTGSDADAGAQLWQVQLAGAGQSSFSYQLLGTLREALRPTVTGRERRQTKVPKQKKMKREAPPPSGASDPDKVGTVDWQLVLYCAGPSPTTALRFAHFVLHYKLQKSSLSALPDLHVHMATGTRSKI